MNTLQKIILASLTVVSLAATAADFSKVEKSMLWTPAHSITNDFGTVRLARTAPASKVFWTEWRTNKIEMKKAGFSARPTTNGWEAIHYIK